MSNTSATGGYLLPTSSTALPGGLTLTQFIQTILVGISGLTNTLVRPRWQVNPPKQPDIGVNWLAFGLMIFAPNANAYVDMDSEGNQISQRHQDIRILCGFYGPDANEYASIVTDGFQIQQNLEALTLAGMGYVSTGPMISVPDLINERWFNRVEMEVNLRREISRIYPVLPILGAVGTINSEGSDIFESEWEAGEVS